MKRVIVVLVLGLFAFAHFYSPPVVRSQAQQLRIAAVTGASVTALTPTIDAMLRGKELLVRNTEEDPLVPGGTIERLDQYYKGVPIWNANVTVERANGLTTAIFGLLYGNVSIDVTTSISSDAAKAVVEREGGATIAASRVTGPYIVGADDGSFRMAWIGDVANTANGLRVFVDARTGAVVQRLQLFQTQVANAWVGHGVGVLGDDKKLSIAPLGGGFVLFDTLRPPDISTFALQGNLAHALDFLNGKTGLSAGDYSFSSSATWPDSAAVDAHAYASYTYDYYFKRFARRGLDNADHRVGNIVHVVNRSDLLKLWPAAADFFVNAFYDPDLSVMVYGEGLPGGYTLDGQYFDYLSGGLDVVAHELTHGVTDYTSRLNYVGESGALNEAFSDIMGTSVEFAFHPAGTGLRTADYVIGEDVVRAAERGTVDGIRSMSNPALFGQPDHYSRRLVLPLDDEHDNGGVHYNSGIANQAFYLAIEGGTNRTSGIRVQGVGAANRIQIERVFYRAFTQLLPSSATFAVARAATLQAAQDLYGATSAPYNAVRDAWAAVGVN